MQLLIIQNKEQVYGIQMQFVDGKWIFAPILDRQNVDFRRSKLGLPTLKEYKKQIAQLYGKSGINVQ